MYIKEEISHNAARRDKELTEALKVINNNNNNGEKKKSESREGSLQLNTQLPLHSIPPSLACSLSSLLFSLTESLTIHRRDIDR
jgi:hypothetical protein